jgi:hypothetical protein
MQASMQIKMFLLELVQGDITSSTDAIVNAANLRCWAAAAQSDSCSVPAGTAGRVSHAGRR